MNLRVEFKELGQQGATKFITVKFIPGVGEFLETDTHGSCEVLQVIHTPESKEQDAILILKKRR